jgi:sugar phosphate isomerase/epimerase
MKQSVSRRSFLGSVGVAAAVPALSAVAYGRERFPLSFSTLGCPKWDWLTILKQARDMGFSGIEIRGIQGQMELPKVTQFAGAAWRQSLKDVEALNLQIVNLGSSVQLHQPDAAKNRQGLDSGKAFIDLAHNLKSPYIRVFGDQFVKEEPREATIERIVKGFQELARHAKGSGVSVLIESHGDFHNSPLLLEILGKVNLREAALLWDTHHTFVSGKEQPQETYKRLRRFVKHLHLKDSRPDGEGVRYTLLGQGTVPVKETVRVLAQGGYRGFYSLEWEKGWHPELEEPEIAFPHFVKTIREYLAAV